MPDYSTRPLATYEHIMMAEALARYTRYYAGQDPREMPMGLSRRSREPILPAGLVEFREADGYYHLTERGAGLLRQWVDAGLDWQTVRSMQSLPELRIPVEPEWQGERWEVFTDDGDDAIGWGPSCSYLLFRPDGEIIRCNQDFTREYTWDGSQPDSRTLAEIAACRGNYSGLIISAKQVNKHWVE